MTIDLILISILEGVTEFLPISSTAHLIVSSKLLSLDLTSSYIKFYLLFIQLGALLAGMFLFSKKILADRKLFTNIAVSFLPSAVIGFVLYKTFKHLLEGNFILISAMLFLGGIIFIYLEKFFMKITLPLEFGKEEITILDAFVVGVAQAVAIIPGVSRSGATIIAGVLRGIKKRVIIEYTFILALPTLASAILYDVYKSKEMLTTINSYNDLIFGLLISFVTGLATLFLIRKYLPKISLNAFGIYRIILSLIILFIFVL